MRRRDPFQYFKNRLEISDVMRPFSDLGAQRGGLLHGRGIDDSYTAMRDRFGPMYFKINGENYLFWKAVDHQGKVLKSFVKKT